MTIIEGRTTFAELPPNQSNEVDSSERPPFDTWIDELLKEGGNETAILLIARIAELHLSEGFRLIQKYYQHYTDHPAIFFNSLCNHSRIVSENRADFFSKIENRVSVYIPQIKQENLKYTYNGFYHSLGIEVSKSKNKKPHTTSIETYIDKSGISDKDKQKIAQYFHQINSYYGRLLVPTINFPEPPPPPEDKAYQLLLRAADNLCLHDGSEMNWQTELQASYAVNGARQKYEQNWNPDDSHAPHESETTNNGELFTRYNIFELLPPEAKKVEAITMSARGMIFRYRLGSQNFVWFDGQSYQLNLFKQVQATTKHFLLEGVRNGEVVTIIDNQEFVGFSVYEQKKIGEHLLVTLMDWQTHEANTLINGIDFDLSKVQQTKLLDQDKLALTDLGLNGTRALLIDLTSNTVEAEITSQHRRCEIVTIGSYAYFVFHGNGPTYICDPKKKQIFRKQITEKLAIDQYDPSSWYDLFDIDGQYYIAYSAVNSETKVIRKALGEADFIDGDQEYGRSRIAYKRKSTDQGPIIAQVDFIDDNSNLINNSGIVSSHVRRVEENAELFPINTRVNRSQLIVYELLPDSTTPQMFYLKVFSTQSLKSKFDIFYKTQRTLKSVYISAEGKFFTIQSDFNLGKNQEGYYVDQQLLHTATANSIFIVGEIDSKPILFIPQDGQNTVSNIIFHGEQKFELLEQGEELVVNSLKATHQRPEVTDAVGAFNPTKGQVKEVGAFHQKGLKRHKAALSLIDSTYLKLAQHIERYLDIYHQLYATDQDYFDESNQGSLSTYLQNDLKKLRSLIKVATENIVGEQKNYFTKDIQKKAITDYYTEHPEELVELLPSGIDPLSSSFENLMIQTVLPELWQHEQATHAALMKEAMSREISYIGESKPQLHHDQVLYGGMYELRGGNAREQFIPTQPIGIIKNFSKPSITNTLQFQADDGWKVLPFPDYSLDVKKLPRNSSYTNFINGDYTYHRLLLQPNSILIPESVEVILKDGTTVRPEVSLEQGYPFIELPAGATEVRYKDQKVRTKLASLDWKLYEKGLLQFKKNYPEIHQGLTEPLPLDPRLQAKLALLKKLPPVEACSGAERLCGEAGIYDMNNDETEYERIGKNAARTLDFARVRALSLQINPRPDRNQPEKNHYYAGVCAESSLLLVAMLRWLGFAAGVTIEYRAKQDGEYSSANAHASVFALWPDPDDFSDQYQLIYLDGTFTACTDSNFSPPQSNSLAEQIMAGEIEVDDEIVEAITQNQDKSRTTENTKNNNDPAALMEYQFKQLEQTMTSWELGKKAELSNYTLLDLSRIYQTLVGINYDKPTAVTESFLKAANQDEQWKILFSEYNKLNPDKKTWKKRWGKVRLSLQPDNKVAIYNILLELRKLQPS